jgi:N-terminal half of MaoC dehydratase
MPARRSRRKFRRSFSAHGAGQLGIEEPPDRAIIFCVGGNTAMNLDIKGKAVVDTEIVVDEDRLRDLVAAIGTSSAADVAPLVPFFGPTAAGEKSVVGPLGLDLSKALQGAQSYEWHRPFRPGERVKFRVTIEDVTDRGAAHFASVLAEFRDTSGALIQRQRTIFIERGHDEAA